MGVQRKIVNCQIIDSDIRFYREFRKSVLEIHYKCSLGEGILEFNPKDMEIFILLEKTKLSDFKGAYFRIGIDENDHVVSIVNILNDEEFMEYHGRII